MPRPCSRSKATAATPSRLTATARRRRPSLPDRRAAIHARLALGNVVARDTKRLEPDDGSGEARMRVEVDKANPEEGHALLEEALIAEPKQAVESLGHIRWKRQVGGLSDLLAERGETEEAALAQDVVYDTLSTREIQGSRDHRAGAARRSGAPEPVPRRVAVWIAAPG